MKKFIILFSVFLLLSCSNSDKNTNIQTNTTTDNGNVDVVKLDMVDTIDDVMDLGGGYIRRDDIIFFDDKEVPGVDLSSFQVLSWGLSRDEQHIYDGASIHKFDIDITDNLGDNIGLYNLLLKLTLEDDPMLTQVNAYGVVSNIYNYYDVNLDGMIYLRDNFFYNGDDFYIYKKGAGVVDSYYFEIIRDVDRDSFREISDFMYVDDGYIYYSSNFVNLDKKLQLDADFSVVGDRALKIGNSVYYLFSRPVYSGMATIEYVNDFILVGFLDDVESSDILPDAFNAFGEINLDVSYIKTKSKIYIDFDIFLNEPWKDSNIYYPFIGTNSFKDDIDLDSLFYKYSDEGDDIVNRYFNYINSSDLKSAYELLDTDITKGDFELENTPNVGKTHLVEGPYLGEDGLYHSLIYIGDDYYLNTSDSETFYDKETFYYTTMSIKDDRIVNINMQTYSERVGYFMTFDDFILIYNPLSGMYRLDGSFERDFDVSTGIDHRFVSDDLEIFIREMR